MDRDVVLNKLESLRRCVARVEDKVPASATLLRQDVDLQDIIVVNLERAVQTCVDIGMHLIGSRELPIPGTMTETFGSLRRAGILDAHVAERMAKAVGFRNTAVHAYQDIDWEIVFRIATEHLADFRAFARQVLAACR